MISPPTHPRWYCLRSQPKREHVAAVNLRERVNLEVFSPRIRATKPTRGGVVVSAVEALFPGYLFARFLYPDQLRHVTSTCGVTGIVTFRSQPPAIAEGIIDSLRSEVAHAQEAPIAPVLVDGAWVRILSGCFQYLEGRVLHFDPKSDRVQLLLAMLGSDVPVTVGSRCVAPISDSYTGYPTGLKIQDSGIESRQHCQLR